MSESQSGRRGRMVVVVVVDENRGESVCFTGDL